MVIMRIHCGACGGQWEVYSRQRDNAAARICPHCEHRIDGKTWEKKILPAFQAVGAANMALAYNHADKHVTDFEVDFIADGKFKNAAIGELQNQIYSLQSALEELQEAWAGNKSNGGKDRRKAEK